MKNHTATFPLIAVTCVSPERSTAYIPAYFAVKTPPGEPKVMKPYSDCTENAFHCVNCVGMLSGMLWVVEVPDVNWPTQ